MRPILVNCIDYFERRDAPSGIRIRRAANSSCWSFDLRLVSIRDCAMKPDELAALILDIDRSVQMRMMLSRKLTSNEEVDLVEEWHEIEQLDLEIARKIRKRPIE
jgi:hypothetical protein